MDSSNSTTFLLFDRDATILLKKSCADMLESHDKSFRVKKVGVDDDIIQKFNDFSMKSVDVYAGNGEFGREKQRVVNESTIDIERIY
ncbi:hypothetical protein DEO72_LG11g2195 [Vigna unguiculata]|uniref:Uncharacterized protein n=1 Tax=Vigna unguiculata TaxID=3917 RepID=A0A4D6NNI8_VIGUN|nr:hypothetical protein DEO72_LG11g2195 [Vigna unguiculata]